MDCASCGLVGQYKARKGPPADFALLEDSSGQRGFFATVLRWRAHGRRQPQPSHLKTSRGWVVSDSNLNCGLQDCL